jgi:hypothetical protein
MDASFTWRRTSATDLSECLTIRPAKNGAEGVGLKTANAVWRQLFEMTHASRSAVIEMHCDDHVEIVGFGFASFVKKDFADAEALNPRPGLNCRIIESVACGRSVIASYDEVRNLNTRGELQQVILDTSWKNNSLNPAQRDEVRFLLGRAYQELFAGYVFGRILTELVDALDLWHIEGQRVWLLDRFDAFRLSHPEATWNSDRALALVTPETMGKDPHSVGSGLFHHRPHPQFAFTLGEQQLLELALEGYDDGSAAKALFVTVPAIKRRWENIFRRVAAIRPDLSPSDGDGRRGIQKRQRIVAHVRNHPEELRPFDFGNHGKLKPVTRDARR